LVFGNVAVGSPAQSTLTIANTGNSALTVSGINYPSGFSGNWSSGTIAANSSQPVTVTFAPTSAVSYSGAITVNSDATSGANTIAASGTGTSTPTRTISLSGSLAFGSVAVGSSGQSTLTIANTGNSDLTVSSISYPDGFIGSWISGTIAAGGSQPVTVTFTPTSTASYSGTITVNSDKTSGVNTIAASGTGTSTSMRQVFGTVWNDADGNRMLDEGEQSLSGWTVYADLNGNGNRDNGEPFTVSDANGNYKLTGLSAGSVDVRLEMQSQFTQTLPGASGADPGSFLQIQLNYLDNKLSASQKAIVASAVARWQEMLLTSLPLQIDVEVKAIDGAGNTAAQASPSMFRSTGAPLPSRGIITIDEADVASAESQGWLKNLILHEMGHIFGIGSMWNSRGLLTGAGGADPRFTGSRGTAEYRAIFGTSETSAPVENTGGSGTRDKHWRKSVFGEELMTGSVSLGSTTSRITVGAMHDFGYAVNYLAADAYAKPSGSALVPAGLETGRCDCQAMVLAALGVYDPPQPNARRTAAVGVPNTYRVNLTTPSLHGFHFGVVPSQLSAPVITSAETASGTVNQFFSYQITANNTPTSYNANGLPAGVSVNTTSGLISGTPTASGMFPVTLSAANAGGTGNQSLTLTVNPATPPGTLQFTTSTATVSESAGTLMLTVSRAGGSSGAVSVSYATANGTATAGSDYTATSGTLNWPIADTVSKTITVPILNDSVPESSETFTATLTSPTGGATLGTPSTATVTITDDDGANVSATHSAGSYRAGTTLTISGQFTYPAINQLQSLKWTPTLPAGWTVASVTGDGSPDFQFGDIVFVGSSFPNPIILTIVLNVPAAQTGIQQVSAVVEYQLNGMVNSATTPATPGPLLVSPLVYHTADYRDPAWVIDGSEVNRVLSYWRAGGYQPNAAGSDGYSSGATVSPSGPRHAADYRDPAWVIDGSEVNRVLSYWRAGGYQANAAGADGYSAGAAPASLGAIPASPVSGKQTVRQIAGRLQAAALVAASTASLTQSGPATYTAGGTVTITNRLVYGGTLTALLLRPQLPVGWTITAVAGDGSPELRNGEIVPTGTLPTGQVEVRHTVQIPAGQSGSKSIRTEVETTYLGDANASVAFGAPDPLVLPELVPPNSPAAVTPPTDLTVNVGQTATFSIVASGTAPLTYQWRKAGANLVTGGNISGSTSATLMIANVGTNDAGVFDVVVSNSVGSITNNATLTVNRLAQTITFPALPNKLPTDSPFTLAATSDSGRTVTYQSSNLAVATVLNSTVTLTGVEGVTIITASEAGNATYLPATPVSQSLTVSASSPRISAQPQSQTNSVGANVTFNVTATGDGSPFTYQWRSNGVSIVGATSSSLTLLNIQTSYEAGYDVQVSNATNTVTSSAATLTVNYLPVITTQATNLTVIRGQSASFTVVANGKPAPSYQWRKNSTVIPSATSATYTIASATNTDAASYDVLVFNTVGTNTSSAVTLTVNGPVEITTHPQSQTTNVGSNVTFTVLASGTAPIAIQWRSNTVPILGATGSSLVLNNVQTNFEASYDAVLTNVVNSVTSSVATLTVNFAPYFTLQPTSQTVTQGQANVSFTAAASGKPMPTYQWRKDGANISGVTSATYTIASVSAASAGNYDVVAGNSVGSITNTTPATLTVNGPVQITSQPASQTVNRGSTLTLSVNASGTAPISYQWRFGGTVILNATNSVYSLLNIQTTNAGNYDVVLANVVNTTTGSVAVVTVVIPAGILTQPVSRTVLPGSTVTFTAVAEGTGTLTYQWTRNGQNISGATSSVLTLSNVTTNDQAAYRVIVGNSLTSVTSDPAMLTVVSRQVKVGDVQTTNLTAGAVLNVSVMLTGNGAENAVSLSVAYDTNSLTLLSVSNYVTGATLNVTNVATNGQVGVLVTKTNGQPFAAGSNGLFELQFTVGTVTGQLAAPLILPGTPLPNLVSDATNGALVSEFAGGSVTFKTAVSPTVATSSGLLGETFTFVAPSGSSGASFIRVLIFDLGVDSLGNPIRVNNADGTNAAGVPFVIFPGTIAPGQRVDLALEYYVSDRKTVPAPRLVTEVVSGLLPVPSGTTLDVERVQVFNGRFHVDFKTIAGRLYYVQYAVSIAGPWETSFPPVAGTGSTVQWVDNGPPRTSSLPGGAGSRFYRILLGQ